MRILIIPKETYPTHRIRLTQLFQKELASRNHKLYWLMQSRDYLDGLDVINKKNNKFYVTPSQGKGNLAKSLLNKILKLKKYEQSQKILKEHKIDFILFTNELLEGFIAFKLRKQTSKPIIFYLSSLFFFFEMDRLSLNKTMKNYFTYLYGLIQKKFFIKFINEVDLFHPISKYMGDYYLKRTQKDTFHELPLCASNNFLNPKLEKKMMDNSKEETKILIYIGQITSVRRLDFLVRVLSKVTNKKSNIPVLLRLVGPYTKKVQTDIMDSAKLLGLASNIDIVPEVPIEEIPSYLSESYIGLSPIPPTRGYIVSSPTKIIEYMAMGLPVVATRSTYDQKHLLEESKGGIAVAHHEDQYAKAIVWLLENPLSASKMGKLGKRWVSDNRNYHHLAKNLEKIYIDLLTKKQS